MSYASDIKRLAKQDVLRKGLAIIDERPAIPAISTPPVEDIEVSGAITSPLTLTILTYDDTKDIEIEDTSAATWTLKTAATAIIVDAEGREFEIDTITFTTPP